MLQGTPRRSGSWARRHGVGLWAAGEGDVMPGGYVACTEPWADVLLRDEGRWQVVLPRATHATPYRHRHDEGGAAGEIRGAAGARTRATVRATTATALAETRAARPSSRRWCPCPSGGARVEGASWQLWTAVQGAAVLIVTYLATNWGHGRVSARSCRPVPRTSHSATQSIRKELFLHLTRACCCRVLRVCVMCWCDGARGRFLREKKRERNLRGCRCRTEPCHKGPNARIWPASPPLHCGRRCRDVGGARGRLELGAVRHHCAGIVADTYAQRFQSRPTQPRHTRTVRELPAPRSTQPIVRQFFVLPSRSPRPTPVLSLRR